MKKELREKNIYSYMVLKMLLAFGALLLMQTAFYAANSHILRPESTSEWGGIVLGNVVFGMATTTTFLLPWFLMMLLPLRARWSKWYRTVSEVLYIVAVLVMIVPRGVNGAYYQYTYRLLSDEIFSYLGISGQMGALAPHFAIDYWYAWIVPLAVFILFLVLNSGIRLAPRKAQRPSFVNDMIGSAVSGVVVWFLMRGGFGAFIETADAAHFAQPKNMALVNNDSYNILRTLFAPDLEEKLYMDSDEAQAVFPARQYPNVAESDSVRPRRNIVLIVVESLGQEFMGCYNTQADADTRTPFLDSIARYSTLYDGRANGKKSIEGITAINTGIPNLMDRPLTNSVYDSNRYTGLPAMMKRHGYHTAFFHGTYNGVMGFDRTCKRIGFDEYLGKDEYEAEGLGSESDYDGAWGILDEPFLQYTARRIGTYSEPFFAEVFTVSSHHPYPMPEEYRERFREGRHPILKCVEYTDYALRRFFDEARRQPWYANTLFIITGDHSGHGLSPEYNDYDGWYRIPMMVYDPQHPEGRREPTIVQQTDIYPTLADWLGAEEEIVCFGHSLMRGEGGWQVYYGNGYYCMVANNAVAPEVHDISVVCGDYEEGRPEHLRFLRALIQQYNSIIINNKLTIE